MYGEPVPAYTPAMGADRERDGAPAVGAEDSTAEGPSSRRRAAHGSAAKRVASGSRALAPQSPLSDALEPQLSGSSEPTLALRARIEKIAPFDVAVLISGASGTGKEVAARALHRASSRRGGPLVIVDCAAIAPALFEGDLFGHVKGALRGAHAGRAGHLETAHGGTLFLDEIGELPLSAQVLLFRFLETKTFKRAGSVKEQTADVRVVASTNRQLEAMVGQGRFREELYRRLNAFRLQVPALCERLEDLPQLATALLARCSPAGTEPKTLTGEALRELRGRPWRGNVRELYDVLSAAFVMAGASETITLEHLLQGALLGGPPIEIWAGQAEAGSNDVKAALPSRPARSLTALDRASTSELLAIAQRLAPLALEPRSRALEDVLGIIKKAFDRAGPPNKLAQRLRDLYFGENRGWPKSWELEELSELAHECALRQRCNLGVAFCRVLKIEAADDCRRVTAALEDASSERAPTFAAHDVRVLREAAEVLQRYLRMRAISGDYDA
jgi:DNA-binding NtrC family response regulator